MTAQQKFDVQMIVQIFCSIPTPEPTSEDFVADETGEYYRQGDQFIKAAKSRRDQIDKQLYSLVTNDTQRRLEEAKAIYKEIKAST